MRIVQKFGGTSVGGLERIRKVADVVEQYWLQNNEIVVVVSAMSGHTTRLEKLANELQDNPNKRETDALLATGEQVSAALLAIELNGRDIPSYSYNALQMGFFTSDNHQKAVIHNIETIRFQQHLHQREVPVFTGFQGMTKDGHITTLGRGGSDTSAVALAIALQADICEIYTDVDGVYTCDPRIVPHARKLNHISYEEMLEMASLGAKVLHTRSVSLAMNNKMPLHLRSSFKPTVQGTIIKDKDENMEQAAITGLTYKKDEAKITIVGVPDQPGVASRIFGPIADADINVDVIVQNISEHGHTDLTFTTARSDYPAARSIVENVCAQLGARQVRGDTNIAKISIVGIGMRTHAGVARNMFKLLAEHNINIEMITTSEIKVTVVICEKYVEEAMQALHTGFGLDETDSVKVSQ
ncbi:MAG: aspartate kinase [Mariprofundales bacterium]